MGLDGCYWMALNESWKSVSESWYWSQNRLDSKRVQNMFLASKLIKEWPWIIPKIFLTLTYVCHWMTLNMPKPCVWNFHEAKQLNTLGHGACNPCFSSPSAHHGWHCCLVVPHHCPCWHSHSWCFCISFAHQTTIGWSWRIVNPSVKLNMFKSRYVNLTFYLLENDHNQSQNIEHILMPAYPPCALCATYPTGDVWTGPF